MIPDGTGVGAVGKRTGAGMGFRRLQTASARRERRGAAA